MRKHIPSERLSDEQYSDVIANYKPGAAKHMPPNLPPLPQVHAARRYSDAMREYGLACWKAAIREQELEIMRSRGELVAALTEAAQAISQEISAADDDKHPVIAGRIKTLKRIRAALAKVQPEAACSAL